MNLRPVVVLLVVVFLVSLLGVGCAMDDSDDAPKTTGSKQAKASPDQPKDEADAPEGQPAGAPAGTIVGGSAREFLLVDHSYGREMPKDTTGVAVGAKHGPCQNVDPLTELQGLANVAGGNAMLSRQGVLVASCGSEGWALAMWKDGSALTLAEFSRGEDGLWKETPDDHFAGCGLPEDVIALWRLEYIECD